MVYDPVADKDEAKKIYNIDLFSESELLNLDAVVVAVAHEEFKDLNIKKLNRYLKNKIIIDIKGIFNKKEIESENYVYWRL